MKRAGFTMIELIFVIVILGILASVALPKLIGVKDQADEGLVKGFVGTLNRTVAPAKWSKAMTDGNGSIIAASYEINTTDTDFPASFAVKKVDTTVCFDAATHSDGTATGALTGKIAATTTDGKYIIICRDGNASSAPKFWYAESNNTTAGVDLNDSKIKLP